MSYLSGIQRLNGNTLKIIALVAMTFDHLGYIFFPDIVIFRIIGRLAFPIFGFMIAEGCFYTRSKIKYISLIALVALGYQCVIFFMAGSLYMCVLVTFFISILIIFAIQSAVFSCQKKDAGHKIFFKWLFAVFLIAAAAFICTGIPELFPGSGFGVDYGFLGVMLPAAAYIPRLFIKENSGLLRFSQAAAVGIWLILLSAYAGLFEIQWYSLFAAVLLMFYDGTRGKLKLKYLFYIYYPAHLALFYIIASALGISVS